jgi:hypothetical protein
LLKITDGILPIPYGPADRPNSKCYGFKDLKLFPELISEIPELRDWPEFEELIRALNVAESPFCSFGCEKSVTPFSHDDEKQLKVKLTSYVEFGYAARHRNEPTAFETFVKDLSSFAARRPLSKYLHVDSEIQRTRYVDDNTMGWSLTIWISGYGASETEAREAWGGAIAALREFIVSLYRT